MSKSVGAAVLAVLLTAAGALASDVEGLWLTPPDRKGQTAYIAAEPCDSGYCGTIVKVFDPKGHAVNAPIVGTRVFWNMVGANDVYRGRAYVPAHGRNYSGKMQVDGDQMTVSGCLGPICQSQVWQRVP